MPHQNVEAGNATAQNAATDPTQPSDMLEGGEVRPEPSSYAAPDVADATLAPPAAGEVADYMDEGEDLGGDEYQAGRDRTDVAAHSRSDEQGPKTTGAQRQQVKDGQA